MGRDAVWFAFNMHALLDVEVTPCRGSDISEWNAFVCLCGSCRIGRGWGGGMLCGLHAYDDNMHALNVEANPAFFVQGKRYKRVTTFTLLAWLVLGWKGCCVACV